VLDNQPHGLFVFVYTFLTYVGREAGTILLAHGLFVRRKTIRGATTMEIMRRTRTLKKHFGARPPTSPVLPTSAQLFIDQLRECFFHQVKKERFLPNSS
jgi:hypothetical protein